MGDEVLKLGEKVVGFEVLEVGTAVFGVVGAALDGFDVVLVGTLVEGAELDGFNVEKVGAAVVGVEVVGLMVGLVGAAVTVGGFNTNEDESPTTP